MKGTIRFIAGFLITVAAVGGIDTSETNKALYIAVAVAIVGLVSMYSGAKALNESDAKDRG